MIYPSNKVSLNELIVINNGRRMVKEMCSDHKYDPYKIALDLREQFASEKRRLGFLLGAGTSMSVGMPGIDELTIKVEEQLKDKKKDQFNYIKNEVNRSLSKTPNVEDILNRVRLCREIIGDSTDKECETLKGKDDAKNLDATICKAIYDIVSVSPPKGNKPFVTLAQWLHALHGNRDWPVEIFTLNYDLIFERSMEQVGLPFFDGFVGSVEPFFVPESVEADGGRESVFVYPPRYWSRLWKLHGSIGWYLRTDPSTEKSRIARLTNYQPQEGEELIIFPSREKYEDSRKLPFITFQDRLRKFLTKGETLLIIVGYSFSDDHINEIIFQSLRSNNRLAVVAFVHNRLSDRLIDFGKAYRNIAFYGNDKACIGGITGIWTEPSKNNKDEKPWPFWDNKQNNFTLGDFNSFTTYLESFIGFHSSKYAHQPSISEKHMEKHNTTEENT